MTQDYIETSSSSGDKSARAKMMVEDILLWARTNHRLRSRDVPLALMLVSNNISEPELVSVLQALKVRENIHLLLVQSDNKNCQESWYSYGKLQMALVSHKKGTIRKLHTPPLLQLLLSYVPLLFCVPVVMLQKQNKSRKKQLGSVDYSRISLWSFVFLFLCMFDFVRVLLCFGVLEALLQCDMLCVYYCKTWKIFGCSKLESSSIKNSGSAF